MSLNAKQQLFVAAYLVHKNATKAAIDAGYSEKTARTVGPRMLQNVAIQQAVQEKVQSLTEKLGIGPEYILSSLKEVAERCKQAVQVMEFDHESKQMVPTGEWKFEHHGANKALELLGKYQKMWTDNFEFTEKPGIASAVSRFKTNGKK